MLRVLLDDVRFAGRAVARAGGISLLVVATVALGVGANTAVFSVLHAALLTPLPYPDPDRLVRVRLDREDGRYLPGAAFIELRDASRTLHMASVFTYTEQGVDLAASDRPERVSTTQVSSNYFDVLGVRPVVGRVFERDEEREGSRLAVVSERIWHQYLDGAADAVGRTLAMNGVPVHIVGVLPAEFRDPLVPAAEVWFPENLQPGVTNSWGNNRLTAIARLRDGHSIDDAAAEGRVLVGAQGAKYGSRVPRGLTIVPLQQDIVGPAAPMLYVLLGAVGLLLLLACVNVATLLLTRAAARAQEIAIRSALGSARVRIVRQMLAESLLLSLAGGAAGLLLARVTSSALVASAPVPIAGADPYDFGTTVYVYGLGLTVLTGLAFGLVPALRASGADVNGVLRAGGRGTTGSRSQRAAWNVMVGVQVAIALTLLIGAGLLLKSFQQLRSQPLGVTTGNVTVFQVQLPGGRYADGARRIEFHRLLHERLSSLPDVRAAGAISRLPLTGTYHSWGARRTDVDLRVRDAEQRVIQGDFFEAMGIPLLRGRIFTSADRPDARRAVILSRSLADALFPNEEALGREVAVLNMRATVVGIVADVPLTPRGGAAPTVYHSHVQFAENRNWPLSQVVAADATTDVSSVIRREVARIDPALVVYDLQPFAAVVGRGVARERFALQLLGLFAALALLLASIGVFGVLAYSVASRRKELAIRLALGATPSALQRGVLRAGGGVAVAGICGGLAGAVVMSRWLESLLFEVGATDVTVFLAASVVLLLVALAAAWLPARGVTRVSPLETLTR